MIFALDYISGSSVWVCFYRATLEKEPLVFSFGLHMGFTFIFFFPLPFVDLFYALHLGETLIHLDLTMECVFDSPLLCFKH